MTSKRYNHFIFNLPLLHFHCPPIPIQFLPSYNTPLFVSHPVGLLWHHTSIVASHFCYIQLVYIAIFFRPSLCTVQRFCSYNWPHTFPLIFKLNSVPILAPVLQPGLYVIIRLTSMCFQRDSRHLVIVTRHDEQTPAVESVYRSCRRSIENAGLAALCEELAQKESARLSVVDPQAAYCNIDRSNVEVAAHTRQTVLSWFLVIILQTAPFSGANIRVWLCAHALGAERDVEVYNKTFEQKVRMKREIK